MVIRPVARVQLHAADDDVLHARRAGAMAVARSACGVRRGSAASAGTRPRLADGFAGPRPGLRPARTPRGPPCSARTPSALSTRTEILMSPVVIIFMLTPSARARRTSSRRRRSASACRQPTTDTLLTSSTGPIVAAELGDERLQRRRWRAFRSFRRHGEADGRPAVVPTLWAIMSTAMFFSAMAAKTRWLTPGRSGTFSRKTRTSSLASAAPQTGNRRHPLGLGDDPGPLGVGEAAADHERHVELLGELDRPRVHDAGAHARQLQHLVVADGVHLPGLGHEARVGRVDAVDVGVDLALDSASPVRVRQLVRRRGLADSGLGLGASSFSARPGRRRWCPSRRGRAW